MRCRLVIALLHGHPGAAAVVCHETPRDTDLVLRYLKVVEAQGPLGQNDQAEPENCLAAGALEIRWNESLKKVAELKKTLAAEPTPSNVLRAEDKKHLRELGNDVARIWDHPQTDYRVGRRRAAL